MALHSAIREAILGSPLLTGIVVGMWPHVTFDTAVPITSEGLSRQGFRRNARCLLQGILAQIYVAVGEIEEAAVYSKQILTA